VIERDLHSPTAHSPADVSCTAGRKSQEAAG